jgi:hypothetical protein
LLLTPPMMVICSPGRKPHVPLEWDNLFYTIA